MTESAPRNPQPIIRDSQFAPTPEIRLEGVVKRFGRVGAANGVSLSLEKGQLMALLGPSGCGKTTTLRLIAGFEEVDAGEIEIGGQVVASSRLHLPPERRRVGMVFQEYALFPHLSVLDNVRFGLHLYSGDRARRAREVLELVGLSGVEDRLPHELSGGQQQRVALARALAPEPALVLLDEPFSNLDAGLRVRVRAEVRAILKEANATAIFVTHDQEEALSLVDQVVVMLKGQVRQIGSPQELYRQPVSREVAAFVGEANFLPGTADGRTVECELGTLELQTHVTGPVDLLIRPENLQVLPDSVTLTCRVRSSLFFGHDQLLGVETASGAMLNARLDPNLYFALGQPVHLTVKGPVMAYTK